MAENENEKKFMDDKDLKDITPLDLIKELFNNTKNLTDIEDTAERYDVINRALYINDIDPSIADAMIHFIRFWNFADKNVPIQDREPIKIYINSDGGDLTSALCIADAIHLSKTPIWTINTGSAYSGGLTIFIAGDRRIAYPSASFLFHEGSTSLSSIDAGKFKNFSKFYEDLLGKMKDRILQDTKMTEQEYEKKSRDDYWFFVDEAIEKGFCDEIAKELI